MSNPDKSFGLSEYHELDKETWGFEQRNKEDYSLPLEHLSLYEPIRHYTIYLTGSLRDQVVLELEPYSFTIPRWMFRHSDPNEQLEFEAARSDGSSLPEWLKFNPNTLKFSGIPPRCANNERVMVTARDSYGNEVHITFSVHVNRERVSTNQKLKAAQSCEPAGVGKSTLSQQIHAVGKLNKLQESRALLNSLKQLRQ